VASTPLKLFHPGSATISLKLNRKRWPTGIQFLTNDPKATMANPGSPLSGTVTLKATGTAARSRTVASLRFELAATGTATWTPVATVTQPPFETQFDTTAVANGVYDFRVVVSDNTGAATASAVVKARTIQNGAPS